MSPVSRSVSRPVSRSILAGQSNTLASIIKSLFANNEQGFAYDPNDLSTMWQDAVGTVPVTGAGQAVGLIRDKSGRNNHAFQTVSASRPILQRNATTGAYYLAFDGVDDFLQTNSINFTATDKVSLFTGVRKSSDAVNYQAIADFSANPPGNNGSFSVVAAGDSVGAGFIFESRGTWQAGNKFNYTSAQGNAVICGKADILNQILSIQLNRSQGPQGLRNQGTGNYGNYPLYIGRRGGTSLPFNGHIYSLIGIGRLTTDAETTAIEKELAKRTGVYIKCLTYQ